MAAYGPDDDLPTINLSKVQTIFLPQIERVVASMHHIDELFQWLANMLAHYFNVPLLLTWANRSDQYGQSVAQLRTIARQDVSFPEQIIVNDQTASCSAASYEEAYTQTSTARNALFPLSNGPLKAVWPALLGRLLCEQKRPASGAWGCLYAR